MKDNFRGKAAEKKKFDLHYSNLVRQLMLRAEAGENGVKCKELLSVKKLLV